MKKSTHLFAIIVVAITAIMFSCTRVSVPVPGTSCIQVALSSAAGTTSQTVAVNTSITPITYALTSNVSAIIDTIGVSVLGTLPPGVTASFSGGVFTLSGTPTTSTGSPFNYTVTTTGTSCNNNTITGSITVTNCSSITLTSATVTTSQAVAINSPINPITYTIGGGATGEFVTGMPTGVTAVLTGSVLTISGAPTSSTASPYTYTVTTTGGVCTATATGKITVNSNLPILLTSAAGTSAQTLCKNQSISPIVYTLGGGATGATLTGAPGGVTGTLAGGVFTITGSPTLSGPFTYTVTSTGGTSGTATLTGTITVNDLPTIILTSSPATAAQTLSINSPITTIVYTIGGSATGVLFTGAPAGITGTLVGSTFTLSGSPTASGPFTYTVTTTGGSCSNVSLMGTITVTAPSLVVSCGATTSSSIQFTWPPVTGATSYSIVYTVNGGAPTTTTTTASPFTVTGVIPGDVVVITVTPIGTGNNTPGTATCTWPV